MADNEISSLLLKVGVDFEQLEQFVAAMPAVVDVANAVGQQLNSLEIGNADVFREKGARLSRALVAGFQAEALGLSFGGKDIAGIITERVFGQLDTGTANRYVQDVQRLLDNVRVQLPELNAPLVNQQSLNALGQVGALAGQSRRELEGLSSQLDGVLARLSAISEVRLPQRLIQRTPEGAFAPTPTARRAAETLGLSLRDTVNPVLRQTGARGFGPEVPSLAGTSAQLAQFLASARRDQVQGLERQRAELSQAISGQILGAAQRALPVSTQGNLPPSPTRTNVLDELTALLSGPAKRVEGAAERLARATDAAARAEERAAREREQTADRIAGRIAGPGGAAGNALAQPVDASRLLPFASQDIVAARIDPILGDLTESIRANGIKQAITLEVAKDGLARIADGHHRLLVAQALGIQVPTVLQRSPLATFADGIALPGNPFRNGEEFAPPSRVGLTVAEETLARRALSERRAADNEQLAITRGSVNPALAPANVRSRADQLALEARLAADARARASIPQFIGLPRLLAPPLTRGPGPDALQLAQTNVDRLTAAGATPEQLAPFQRTLAQLTQARSEAAAATAASVPSEQALAAAARQLAAARQAEAARAVFAVGQAGVERTTLGTLQGNRLPVSTISDTENARRRQVLQEESLRDGQRRLEDARRRGDDRPFGERPGTSAGPQRPTADQRFRASQPPLEGDIFDRNGNPIPGNTGGNGRGNGGGRGGFGSGDPFFEPAPGNGPRQGPQETLLRRLAKGGREGFLGKEDGDSAEFLARSAAAALRFSLVYGAAFSALRLVTGGFAAGVQGALEFEQALTDLNIATERTGRSNESLAFDLGNISSGNGFTSGEGVAAGARAIGLFGATDASPVDQAEIAKVSTEVASQVAFISGQTLEQVQTQIAGITRSFGIDTLDQSRVADVASFVGRRTGRPGGEILQSLGQIGTLGQGAGFDLEQVAAIIARLTSTTGQTPQAVSGFLSQVLSKADDPNVKRTLRGVGVDTDGTTLAQQIEQLSTLDLGAGQRNQIVQAFGRGRSGQALSIILEQFPEIQGLAEGARTDSEGLAEKDFNQASNTVGAQLRILGTSLKDLATGLASTGVLDFLVLLIEGIQVVVDVLDALVDTFNLIPREVRSTIAVLGELTLAFLLLSRAGRAATFASGADAASGVVGRLGAGLSAARGGAFARGARDLLDTDVDLSRSGVRAGAGRLGLLRATPGVLAGGTVLPGGAAGLTGAGVAGLAGLAAAVGVGIFQTIQEAGASSELRRSAAQSVATANTPEEFAAARERTKAFQESVEERKDFKLLSKDSLTLGLGTLFGNTLGSADEDKEFGTKLAEAVEAREKKQKELAASDDAGVFGGFGADEVTQGLSELAERGFTAADQLRLLNQAFDGLITKAGQSSGAVGVIFAGQAETFSRAVATGTIGAGNEAFAESLKAPENRRSRFTDIFRSDFSGLAGGLGALAGGGSFNDGFEAESGNLADEALKSLLPGVESRNERNDRIQAGIDAFTEGVGDPELQDKLAQNVTDVLRSRGKDPSLGPVTLAQSDIDAIREGQIETLGPLLDGLPEDVREAYLASLPETLRAAVGDFNGVSITAANAAAVLNAVRQTAPKAGQDLTLTSGSAVEGAQEVRRQFEQKRGELSAIIPTEADPGLRQDLIDQLKQLDLDILNAIAGESAARQGEIDSLNDLARSRLLQGDVLGENAITAGGLAAKLALPGLSDNDRRGLEAQQNQLAKKDQQDRLAINAQNALNALPVRGTQARAQQELLNAEARLGTVAAGSLEAGQLVETINRIQDTLAQYAADLVGALAILDVNPNDSALVNQAAFTAATAKFNDAVSTGDPLAIARAARERQLAEFQVQRVDPINLQNAKNNATNNGTGLQAAQVELTNARNDLLILNRGSAEYFNKLAEVAAAQRQLAQEQGELAKASRRSRINPGDELANARADVLDARVDLSLQVSGSTEYYQALIALQNAQRSLAQQERDAARRTRRLGTDSTDSLTQARQDVIDARQKLNEARADGGDTSAEQQDLENAQARERAEAFDRGLNDARFANELGRTSNQEYLAYLQSERERLAERVAALSVTDEGYRQAVEQLQQVDQAIKAAGDQLSGQFNIGDIDIPTPFEVRRSLAAEEQARLGAREAVQGQFSPFRRAGDQGGSVDNRIVNVTISGGDLEAVTAVLAQYVGPAALGRTSVQSAKF